MTVLIAAIMLYLAYKAIPEPAYAYVPVESNEEVSDDE